MNNPFFPSIFKNHSQFVSSFIEFLNWNNATSIFFLSLCLRHGVEEAMYVVLAGFLQISLLQLWKKIAL